MHIIRGGNWTHLAELEQADALLTSIVLDSEISIPDGGWLKACRESLLIAQAEMAKRLGMSRQGYANLELNETKNTVNMVNLTDAAEAMDCEVVYWIRPRTKKTF